MYTRRLLLFAFPLYLCINIFYLFLAAPTASAATDPIMVTSNTSTLHFPRSITYQLEATDTASLLVHALLSIKFNSRLSYNHEYSVQLSSPAHTALFTWDEDLTNSAADFPPVGTQITYYWIITDAASHSYTDTPRTFQVLDNRFSWQQDTQGLYQIHWYNRPATFGQALLQKTQSSLQRISANLGNRLQKMIQLWVYASRDDFQSALPPQMHEWVGGIAFPALEQASIIVEDENDTTLSRDLPHELTHLLFHQITSGLAPLWFDEGLAVYNQDYREYEMLLRFKDALSTHNLLQLHDISSEFPADADRAYLAYAESWNVVDYMYKTFGQSRMSALFQQMKSQDHSFDGDVAQALGVHMNQLEGQWLTSLHQSVTPSVDEQNSSGLHSESSLSGSASPTTPLLIVLGISLTVLFILGLLSLRLLTLRQRVPIQYPPGVSFPPAIHSSYTQPYPSGSYPPGSIREQGHSFGPEPDTL